jgi:hypothetical protein
MKLLLLVIFRFVFIITFLLNLYFEIVVILVNNGADINEFDNDGLTSLHTCCSVNFKEDATQHLKIAEFLLENGALPNLQTEYNSTALHIASCAGEKGIPFVELLLKYGGDPTIENCQAWTPLHHAYSKYGNPKSVQIIQDFINIKNPSFLETFDPKKPKEINNRSLPPTPGITLEQKQQVLQSDVSLKGISQRILGKLFHFIQNLIYYLKKEDLVK